VSTAASTVFLSCPQPQPTPDSVDPNGSGGGGLLPDVPPSAMGGGFDPSLLNPAPSHSDQVPYQRFFTPSSTSVSAAPDLVIVDAQPHSPSPVLPPPESEQSSELPPTSEQSSAEIPPTTEQSSEITPTSEPLVSNADVPTPVPPITCESSALTPPAPERDFEVMEVDREPTPLPDFHFDQNALTRLGDDFRDTTDLLNVEQLEQLRASCLACIWAHRSEWDRDNLIIELGKISRDFVEEVRADHEDEGMDM